MSVKSARVGGAKRRSAVLDWLSKGPFAIIAASLQGGVNYAIVLYLAFAQNLTATGEYRTLFSYYSLLALAAMPESNKVFIKSVVAEDTISTTALFLNRLVCGFAVFVVIALTWVLSNALGHAIIPRMLLAISAISAVVYPFDLYIALLQAQRRFRLLVAVECIRYGGALACFVAAVAAGYSISAAIIAQLLFMGASMVVFFVVFMGRWFDGRLALRRNLALVAHSSSRQARTLSAANFLPSSLDSIDKLAVGSVFGLHILGIYTLAYSTGRFLYNVLKPAMYVYYRRFVDSMPGWPLLIRVTGAFSLLGAVTAAIFVILVAYVPAMSRFNSGKWTTVILFLSYGIGILSAVYSQAFALNRQSIAHHALVANSLGTLAAFSVMGLALVSQWEMAAILLALQYPVRDGLSTIVLHFLRIGALPESPNEKWLSDISRL